MTHTLLECHQIISRIRHIQCQLGWNKNYGSKATMKLNQLWLFDYRTKGIFLENSGLVNCVPINLLRKIGTALAKDKVVFK